MDECKEDNCRFEKVSSDIYRKFGVFDLDVLGVERRRNFKIARVREYVCKSCGRCKEVIYDFTGKISKYEFK